MENKNIAFLLGAGASSGHLSQGQMPPVMKKFLSSSVSQGILNNEQFPCLAEYCREQTGEQKYNIVVLIPAKVPHAGLGIF